MSINLFTKYLDKNFKEHILSIIMIVFFLSEFLTKYLDYYGYEHYRVGIVFKVIFVIGVLIFRAIDKTLIWQLSLLCILFLLSQFFINRDESLFEAVSKNTLYLAKYFFIFIVAGYFNYLKLNSDKAQHLIKLAFIILWVNFIAIIVGVLFNIGLFSTYYHNRFGYNGLMHINSHSSYIYIFALIFVLYKCIKHKKCGPNLWMIVISVLLIGTKTLYLFSGLIGIYLWFHFRLYRNYRFYIASILAVLLCVVFHEKLASLFTTHYSAFVLLYNDFGILTAIASERNLLISETLTLAHEKYWNVINYIIGGSFFQVLRTEMAFVDLYLFWGLGMFLYLKIYNTYISRHYMKHPFLKYAIFSVFFVAFFGGNFFTNAVIAIYIVVFTNGLIFEIKK